MSTTERSKIYTFNPWRGCTRVHAGCVNCYAETMSKRNPSVLGVWGPRGQRAIAAEGYWRLPHKWNADAMRAGRRARVFCASLADIYEGADTMPKSSHEPVRMARLRLWNQVDATPWLEWLILTKRPENVRAMVPEHWLERWPENVMTGTSPCNQETADTCIPALLSVPGRRFLSMEPLLGPVNLAECAPFIMGGDDSNPGICNAFTGSSWHPLTVMFKPETAGTAAGVQWVIVGGESGGNARPFNPDWARSIRDQCRAAGVPFFFKQTGANAVGLTVNGKGGEWADIPDDLRIREFPR